MGLDSLRPGSSKDKESSKSARKFEKKLEFYAKVRDTVTSLSATKSITKKKKLRSRQKKLKPYDLSSLAESLPKLKAPRRPPARTNLKAPQRPPLKLNCKSRQKLVDKEGEKLRELFNGSAFKSGPLAAIHQRILERTQHIPVEKPKNKTNKNGNKKRKKGKNFGSQAMEI